jgi:hypothetical protein
MQRQYQDLDIGGLVAGKHRLQKPRAAIHESASLHLQTVGIDNFVSAEAEVAERGTALDPEGDA